MRFGIENKLENKLVGKFKRFNFVRLGLILILILSFVFYPIEPIFAATFTDDTQAEFDAGTYNETQWDATNNWVELTDTGKTNGSGDYTSSVKDSGGNSSWDKISWTPQQPYYKELPNNKGQESGYPAGNADMTGNMLLMHMNEASGTIVDHSGEGNNGTTYGGVTYGVSGKFNTALSFDGTDDYVEVPLADDPTAYTIEVWVKPLDTTSVNIIVRTDSSGPTSNYSHQLKILSGSQFQHYLYDGSAKTVTGSTVAVAETWYHVVGVATNNGPMRLYVNGVEEGTPTNIGTMWTGGDRYHIGSEAGGGSAYVDYFNGTIDEVAIYNRALSAEEILNHYKRGALRLKFQMRSCNDAACDTEQFVGPDGTTGTYYSELDNNSTTTPSFNLTNVSDNQYFQYKAYFETDNSSYTPELKSVTIDYTILNQPPNQPTNTSPSNGAVNQSLTPTLTASDFSDPDAGDTHAASQWQIRKDYNLGTEDYNSPFLVYDSGATTTALTSITVPASTLSNDITYYWHVRYKDSFGNWSSYSSETYFSCNKPLVVAAIGATEYKAGETAQLVVQVKDADGNPINTATTTVDIFDTNNNLVVNDASMTYITSSDGLYYYNYTTSTEGVYKFTAKATYNSQIGYTSHTFHIAPWASLISSSSTIAQATWGNATRTLTDYATSSIADAVWDEQRSEHTASGSFGEALQNIVSTASEIASSTWSYTGSALDTTGNAISKVWSYTGSALDTAGNAIAKVWSYTARQLTTRRIATSTTEYIAGVTDSSPVVQVANEADQTTVKYNVELVRKATFDFAGIADGGSTTTLVDSELDQPDDHWNNYELWMMSGNNIGLKRAICDFDKTSHTITLCGDALSQTIEAGDQYVISHERKLVHAIWNWTDRQLTSVGNIASAVWGWTTRKLTHKELTGGGSLATESYIDTATSTIIAEINANETKIDNIYTDTQYISGKVDEILTKWGSYSASDIMGDLDTIKSRIGTSTDTSSDETLFGRTKFIQEKWGTQTAQTIYDTASSTLALVEDVQTELGYNGTSTTAYADLQLVKGYVDELEGYVGTPSDDSSAETLFGRVKGVKEGTDKLIGNIIVVEASVNGSNASTTQFITNLTNSTDDFYNDNVLVFTSGTNAGQVRRIIDYGGTLKKITVDPPLAEAPANNDTFSILSQTAVAGIDAQTIWTYSTRTLTAPDLDSGSLATLADLQKQWTVYLSDFGEVLAGNTYRAKLWVLNYESVPTDANATPTLTIYDAVRNKVVENVEMTKISTGIYEYTYSVPSSAVQGVWETDVSVEVEPGKIIKRNDYWEVEGSPAQVKINSITDNTVPSISANVTISNEGSAGYEYQYEWCVVSSEDNTCGGGDDVFYSSAAKYIQAGEDWNTTLNATVSNTGSYWFKVVVYYGTEKSGASQTFTAGEEEEEEEISTPGGGGGGGVILPEKEKKEEEKPPSTLGAVWDWIKKILKRLTGVEKKTTTLTASVARLEVRLAELDKKVVKVLKPAPPRIVREKVIERRVVVRKPMPQVPKRRARIRLEGR